MTILHFFLRWLREVFLGCCRGVVSSTSSAGIEVSAAPGVVGELEICFAAFFASIRASRAA
jgi:hypothetical protein